MQIEVIETNYPRRTVVATFDTFTQAESYVLGLGVIAYELDRQYPGCADAYTKAGTVLAIQPKGFKLA